LGGKRPFKSAAQTAELRQKRRSICDENSAGSGLGALNLQQTNRIGSAIVLNEHFGGVRREFREAL
jgi:hypothetical protein